MKKAISLCLLAVITIASFAQSDVTTFLGIPVDGSKREVTQKLIGKGYILKKHRGHEYLEGEFNGADVNIHVVTNNNKVWRIAIFDQNTRDEPSIRLRFNSLVRQFENNKRYVAVFDQTIPSEDDISYEMLAHEKQYKAVFFQKPLDTPNYRGEFISETFIEIMSQLPSITQDTSKSEEELAQEVRAFIGNAHPEDLKNGEQSFTEGLATLTSKVVTLSIEESYGEYFIAIYYDNLHNQANGEDL